jgi:hypothetical protein
MVGAKGRQAGRRLTLLGFQPPHEGGGLPVREAFAHLTRIDRESGTRFLAYVCHQIGTNCIIVLIVLSIVNALESA